MRGNTEEADLALFTQLNQGFAYFRDECPISVCETVKLDHVNVICPKFFKARLHVFNDRFL